jgi:predicted DCC family thiol-disulfide oxidoreductase YuxK
MKSPILLYDGYCVLCNFFVKLILRFEKKPEIYFAPLDSKIAQEIISQFRFDPNMDSIIYFDGKECFTYQFAAFEILKQLSFPINLFGAFKSLPNSFNKAMYKFIAKKRYKVFGKYESCPMPSAKFRERMLDADTNATGEF